MTRTQIVVLTVIAAIVLGGTLAFGILRLYAP